MRKYRFKERLTREKNTVSTVVLLRAQQNEVAELKKQINALEQRVNRLQERLAAVYNHTVSPLRQSPGR
jgi:ubiquinone biosynthesis protein UbiJ